MTTISRSRESIIKEVAYGLWEQEGRPVGRDIEHYFKAEQLLDNGSVASVAPEKKATPAATARTRTSASKTATRKTSAVKTAKSSPKKRLAANS